LFKAINSHNIADPIVAAHSDKAVNNALIAKAVEVCASRGVAAHVCKNGKPPFARQLQQNNSFKKFQSQDTTCQSPEKDESPLRSVAQRIKMRCLSG